MFSNQQARDAATTARPSCCSRPGAEPAREARRRTSSASACDADGKPVPKMKRLTVRATALFEAMLHRFYHRPDHGRLRRGEPRLGRRLRRLPRPDRGAALPPPVQLARSPRAPSSGPAVGYALERRPRRRRADVLRLHGPRRRRDLQPDVQVAVDVGRPAEDAAGAAHLGRRQVRRAALAGLDRAGRPHPRPQGRLPGHALRRQGHAEPGPAPAPTRWSSSRASGSTTWARRWSRAACPRATTRCPLGEPAVRRQGKDLTIITFGRHALPGARGRRGRWRSSTASPPR